MFEHVTGNQESIKLLHKDLEGYWQGITVRSSHHQESQFMINPVCLCGGLGNIFKCLKVWNSTWKWKGETSFSISRYSLNGMLNGNVDSISLPIPPIQQPKQSGGLPSPKQKKNQLLIHQAQLTNVNFINTLTTIQCHSF